jgi:hypothetical protein
MGEAIANLGGRKIANSFANLVREKSEIGMELDHDLAEMNRDQRSRVCKWLRETKHKNLSKLRTAGVSETPVITREEFQNFLLGAKVKVCHFTRKIARLGICTNKTY